MDRLDGKKVERAGPGRVMNERRHLDGGRGRGTIDEIRDMKDEAGRRAAIDQLGRAAFEHSALLKGKPLDIRDVINGPGGRRAPVRIDVVRRTLKVAQYQAGLRNDALLYPSVGR